MISLIGTEDVLKKAGGAFRTRRLALGLTQAGLAERSGVKLPTLRKFERTGKISLESFLHLALVLDYLEPISTALDPIKPTYQTFDEVLQSAPKKRQRGRRT
ncbi:MAG: transcriptional regulator [Legionellaceae bacterium]|nr:transcriptional regulator [Legionellaceae bacterium]|tara:strand:+ start:1090 stop:1395 length:306 start_codon:yes stop_codon:yes gene_type:complete